MNPLAPPQTSTVLETVERLKHAIWQRRPILGDIMKKHGGKLLSEYAKDFMDVNPAPGLDERKPELIALVQELVSGRLGADVGAGVAKQLRKLALVSTADHHATIDHPFWVNANIISGIEPYLSPDPDVRYLIVFSFASISVNNASGYSRGILFNNGLADHPTLVRLPILPDKLKMSVVYGTRMFTRDDILRAEEHLKKKEEENNIEKGLSSRVIRFLEETFATAPILGSSQLCSQITRINFDFWRKIFHSKNGAEPAARPPDLIYLDIETLVTQLYLRQHLSDSSSLLHRMLFDPAWQQHVRTQFDGLPGGFSSAEGKGTYFFWGIDAKGHRVALKLWDTALRSSDGSLSVPWTPDGIAEGLKTKKIFPSMLLCYVTVSLFYGMKCLGGFCQVHDLTVIKQAWIKLMETLGEIAEATAVVPVQTKELGGDGMVLAYLRTASGGMIPATGIDLALSEHDTSFGKFVERSKHVTLMEMMSCMLPEMYTVLYGEQERDPELLAIKPEQIFKEMGLEEKLRG